MYDIPCPRSVMTATIRERNMEHHVPQHKYKDKGEAICQTLTVSFKNIPVSPRQKYERYMYV